jgi:outer membrane protein TolC
MKNLRLVPLAAALSTVLLTGCASLSADGGVGDVARLAQPRIGQAAELSKAAPADDGASAARIRQILEKPLTADTAMQLALLNNRGLKASLSELGVAEADFVQAGRMRNPGFSFGRLHGGGDKEIERAVMFDVIGLLTLATRKDIEQRRFEQAKLHAAAQVVDLAFEARKAYFTAVAAAQSAAFITQVHLSAQASSELAERMSKAGNWSKLDQAHERVMFQEAMVQLARARHEATAAREQLVRVLGLSGEQLAFTLPDRLPELPVQLKEMHDAEAQAVAQRLDVLAATRDAEATASALGLTRATSFINVFDAGYKNKSASGAPRENGYEISLELPLFDWGGAHVAKAESVYMQSVHRAADTAIRARSEVREAYSGYRTHYEIARQYRDDIVPLRKRMSEEVLLRYNGMLIGVFELLADSREQLGAVNTAIETQRDFWIADTKLNAAIHGGNPGAKEKQ